MKKGIHRDAEVRNHCDFTGGVRGKCVFRHAEGTNVVVPDPDVARLFPNREAVNETLRAVAHVMRIRNEGGAGRTNPFYPTTARLRFGVSAVEHGLAAAGDW